MKLSLGNVNLGGGGQQNPVVIGVLIVVILAGGFLVARNFMGSGQPSPSGMPPMMPPMPGMGGPGGPGGPGRVPGGPPMPPMPGAPTAAPSQPAPAPAAPAPSPTPAPAATPAARPASPAPAAPRATARPAPGPAGKAASKEVKMVAIKVFNTINVNYPESWKIDVSNGNTAVAFTDGKASFAVRPPDLKAKNAQAIAQSALKSLGFAGSVAGQGKTQISDQDAYWFKVNLGGKSVKVIGVDAATRFAIVESAPSDLSAAYTDTFTKMEQGIRP